MLRWLTVAAVLAPAVARAECPTDLRDLPPTGLQAWFVDEPVLAGEPLPTFSASLTTGAALRVDDANAAMSGASDASTATGSIGGEISGRHGSWSGCLSADVLDVRDGSSHLTAVGQMPFVFVPLRIGLIADRTIRVPLSTRPEFYSGPLSRIAMVTSVSFLDFAVTEGPNATRFAVAPVRIEQALVSQDDRLDRRTVDFQTSMFRVSGTDPGGSGEFRLFSFGMSTTEDRRAPIGTDARGFVDMSFAGLTLEREHWGMNLDGGMLALAGKVDCEQVACTHGLYRGEFHVDVRDVTMGLRAERNGFITADNEAAYEDRATLSASAKLASFNARISTFAARAHRWETGNRAARAGMSAQLSRNLGQGFSAALDGEVVAMPRGSEQAGLGESGARMLASLAWSTSYQRGGRAN